MRIHVPIYCQVMGNKMHFGVYYIFTNGVVHIIVRFILFVHHVNTIFYHNVSLYMFTVQIIFYRFALNLRCCKVEAKFLLHLLITVQYVNVCANLLPS